MKRLLFFIAIFIQVQCLGNSYGRLTSIAYDSSATKAAGKTPFNVTVESSDTVGEVVKKDGSKPGIQNVAFNINDLQSFSFTIPWEKWAGDATVKIKVMRGNELISQMNLQDRNSETQFIGIKNAENLTIRKIKKHKTCKDFCSGNNCSPCSYSDIECDHNIVVEIDPITGYISVRFVTFVNCPADDVDQNAVFTE